MILLLLILLLPDILTANDRRSCRFCQMCSSIAINDSVFCKCDADCQVFGDCCGNHTPPSSCPATQLPPFQDGVILDCISTYLNPTIPVQVDGEAFLMVSTCPDTWIETEGGITAQNCTSPNVTTALPPVTNTATGIVYMNEYCALCNGIRELIAWQTNLVCNQRVYNLLGFKTISEIILSEPDIFQRECQMCAFQIPPITTSGNTAPTRSRNHTITTPRSCIPSVSSCLPRILLEIKTRRPLEDETYTLMKENCASGMLDLVIGSGVVYHNLDCAVCNAEDLTECFTLLQIKRIPDLCFPDAEIMTTASTSPTRSTDGILGPNGLRPPPPLVLPFTITLSNLGGSMVSISTILDQTSISLNCPEGTVPVGLECRPTQCPEGYTERGGICSYVFPSPNLYPGSNITVENCSTSILVLNETDYIDLGNDTIILAEDKSIMTVLDYDEFGRPIICIGNVSFLDCPTALVPLNESDYTHLGNDSIVYRSEIVEVIFYDEHGRPLVCPDNTSSTIITVIQLLAALSGLQVLTYIGCSLSVLGSILILITYTLFSELRTLPGVIVMNLCTTILATNMTFIAGGSALQSYPVKELCSALAIVLHFSYLSQFSWTTIFSLEMTRKFYQARKLMKDSNETKHQFIIAYLCIGWCLPLLIAATSITLNFSIDGLVLYGVEEDGRVARCWINDYISFIIAFLIPLILSLSSNLLMFLLITFLLCRASRDQSKLQISNKFTLIRVWLAILSTTGLTWIFGFVAILDQVNWVWYPFVIFNSTQGLAVFLAFLFTKNILRLYLDLFAYKKLKNHFLTSKSKVSESKIDFTKKISISSATHNSTELLSAYSMLSLDTNNNNGNIVKKYGVHASSE